MLLVFSYVHCSLELVPMASKSRGSGIIRMLSMDAGYIAAVYKRGHVGFRFLSGRQVIVLRDSFSTVIRS